MNAYEDWRNMKLYPCCPHCYLPLLGASEADMPEEHGDAHTTPCFFCIDQRTSKLAKSLGINDAKVLPKV